MNSVKKIFPGDTESLAGPLKNVLMWNSLVVHWSGLRIFTVKGPGLIPGWGTKIQQAVWSGQKIS